MHRVTLVAILTFIVTSTRAGGSAIDEVKSLQGEWQVIELQARGKTIGKDEPEIKNMRFVIQNNQLTVGAADGAAKRLKTFKLDPTKKPKEIDITSLDGQEQGTTAACIYKLEEDRLTICIPYFTKDPTLRPKEFKAEADDGLMLLKLERLKSK